MLRTLATTVMIGLLSACAGPLQPDRTLTSNRLSERTAQIDLRFATGSTLLADNEAKRFRHFIEDLNPSTIRSVTLVHQPAVSESNYSYEEARYQEAMRLIRASKPELRNINLSFAPSQPAANTPPSVSVRVEHLHVATPDCMQKERWHDRFINAPTRNFGCSINSNLGMMIDDPADMLRGDGDIQAEGNNSVRAVGTFKGTLPASQRESANSATQQQGSAESTTGN